MIIRQPIHRADGMKGVGWKGCSEAEIRALEPGRHLAWKAALPLKDRDYWMKMDGAYVVWGAWKRAARYGIVHLRKQSKESIIASRSSGGEQ